MPSDTPLKPDEDKTGNIRERIADLEAEVERLRKHIREITEERKDEDRQ